MNLEVAAPIALVCVAVVALVYKKVIEPGRARRTIAAALGREGWLPIGPGEAPGWPAVMELAMDRAAGKERDVEYDENAGPFNLRVRRREQRGGKALDLYRDAGADGRYAAVGVHEERTRTRTAIRADRHHYVEHEFWVGEARELRVGKPITACSWTAEAFRQAGAPMAAARRRDPEDVPQLASPADDPLVERVRGVLAETDLARRIRADVYLAPGAWVLTAPLAAARSRVKDILALARRVSAALDRPRPED
jgi:hypothetical protein